MNLLSLYEGDYPLDLTDPNQLLISQAECCVATTMRKYYTSLKKRENCNCDLVDTQMLIGYIDLLRRYYVGDDVATALTALELNGIKAAVRKIISKSCTDCSSATTASGTCELAPFEMAVATNGGTLHTYLFATVPFQSLLALGYSFTWYYFMDENQDFILDDGAEYIFISTTTTNYVDITSIYDEIDTEHVSFRLVITCPNGETRELFTNRTEQGELTHYLFYSRENSLPSYLTHTTTYPDIIFKEGEELSFLNMNNSNTVSYFFAGSSTTQTGNIVTLDIADMTDDYAAYPEDGNNYNYAEWVQATITNTLTGINFTQFISVACIPIPVVTGATNLCFGTTNTLTCNYGSAYPQYDVYDSYQWYRNGIAIAGADSVTYDATTGGSYTCETMKWGETQTSAAYVVTALDEYGVEISIWDGSPVWQYDSPPLPSFTDDMAVWVYVDGIVYVPTASVGFYIIAKGTLIYSAGLPNNTTFEWVNYTGATANLAHLFMNAADNYQVITALPGGMGGCAATSNTISTDLTVAQSAILYYNEDMYAVFGLSNGDMYIISLAQPLPIITVSGFNLALVPSAITGFNYNTPTGAWNKIKTATVNTPTPYAVGTTATVDEAGVYAYIPDAAITHTIYASNGTTTPAQSYVLATPSVANTGNIRLQVEGIDCWYVCSTDNGGGIFDIKDNIIGTTIGTYDSNTNTLDFTLESAPYLFGVDSSGSGLTIGTVYTGLTSGETARLRSFNGSHDEVIFDNLSGAFTPGETLDGGADGTMILNTIDGTVDINVKYGWDMISGTGYIAIVK